MASKKAKTSSTAKASAPKVKGEKKSAPSRLSTRQLLITAGFILVIISLLLLSKFFGGGDPIAEHMPADAVFYVHLDLNRYRSADMQAIIDAFQAASGEEQTSSEEAQKRLEEEFGVNYEEDIEPWLGQHVGFALLDLVGNSLNQELESARFVVGAQSKNNGKADALIAMLVANAENDGATVDIVHIEGGQAYDLGDNKTVARIGSIVYIADSVGTLQGLVALYKADTLAAQPAYKQSIAQLPAQRTFTFIFTSKGYGKLIEGMLSNLPAVNLDALQQASQYEFTIGASLTAVEEGLQIDAATIYDEATLPAELIDTMQARRPTYDTLAFYPEDTILYAVSGIQADSYSRALALYPDLYQDTDESFDLLKRQTGIDLPAAIDALDKEVSFGLFPQTGGIAAFLDLGLGFQIVSGSNQEQIHDQFFSALGELVTENFELTPQHRTIGALSAYVIADPFLGQDLLSFGSGSGYAFISTDVDVIEAGLSGSATSLADSIAYQEAWQHFSASAYPVFYFDVPNFLDALQSSADSLNFLKPITLIAGVEEPYAAGVSHSVFLIFIERTPQVEK